MLAMIEIDNTALVWKNIFDNYLIAMLKCCLNDCCHRGNLPHLTR